MIAAFGILADSQPHPEDLSIDDRFFSRVIFEVSGNKTKIRESNQQWAIDSN